MKSTMLRKSIDNPQPTCVIMVRFFRSELEVVSLRGACKEQKLNPFKHFVTGTGIGNQHGFITEL